MELRHFDAGTNKGLIFPSPKCTDFITMTETNFKVFSSEEQFQKFGKGLTGIIKLKMEIIVKSKQNLWTQFKAFALT